MDSPFRRNSLESPYLRTQEAKYGQNSSFSLGPAMHETAGGFDISASADSPQGTAELTAFVQNLLQQMQTRFQSMSDAILVKIDGMASRIEELERAVDEVLREVTSASDDQVPNPGSPMLRATGAPGSPDVRKYSLGGSASLHPASPGITRYLSTGSINSPKMSPLTATDARWQSGSGSLGVNSPDSRRRSTTGALPSSSPRQLSRPASFGTNSPDVRRSLTSSLAAIPQSPDHRQWSDNQS